MQRKNAGAATGTVLLTDSKCRDNARKRARVALTKNSWALQAGESTASALKTRQVS